MTAEIEPSWVDGYESELDTCEVHVHVNDDGLIEISVVNFAGPDDLDIISHTVLVVDHAEARLIIAGLAAVVR